MIFPLALILFFVSPHLRAGDGAKVIKLRGEVFQGKNLVRVKIGETLDKESTLETGKNSMAQVQFSDGGRIVLGPSSTITLGRPQKGGPRIVQLLRGMVRGALDPTPSASAKMVVKTPSAALGVRGTDFLITFNETNKITSSITFRGEVVQVKTDFLPQGSPSIQENGQLLKKLNQDLSTSVRAGEFSASFPGYQDVSSPVKISPQQYESLKSNQDLHFGEAPPIPTAEAEAAVAPAPVPETETVKANDILIPRPQDLHENYIGQEVQELTPRPGGYVDVVTGLYISPPEDAPFNEKDQTYSVPGEFGGVDEKTGNYRPPEGLSLDPLKGFVVLKNTLAEGARGLVSLADRLNASLSQNILSKIDQQLKAYPFINKLNFNFNAEYYYDSNIVESFYGETVQVTGLSSNKILSGASVARKIYFRGETWAFSPKILGQFLYHTERNNPIISQYDRGDFNMVMELSRRQKIFRRSAQISFELSHNHYFREVGGLNNLTFYYKDLSFRVTESLQLFPNQNTLLAYQYFRFQGRPGVGHAHDTLLIHNLELRKNRSVGVSGRFIEKGEKGSSQRSRILKGDALVNLHQVFQNTDLLGNAGVKLTRAYWQNHLWELEKELSLGLSLKKRFSSYLSWALSHQYSTQASKERDRFRYHRHLTGVAMALNF